MYLQAYESATLNYADRQREVAEQLPGVFGPLLPAGVTAGPLNYPRSGGPLDTLTGDFFPEIMLHAGGADFHVEFSPTGNGYAAAFAKASAKPAAVAGGSIRMAVVPDVARAYYEFIPADTAAQPIRFMIYGQKGSTPIDAAAFAKMVRAPGFAKLRHLLDPAVPASGAAVRERYAIEAKINAEAVKVLPPGFRLKLSPAEPGELELVGPRGVNTFRLYTFGTPDEPSCGLRVLCFAQTGIEPIAKVDPDGVPRLGKYAYWPAGKPGSAMMLEVLGTPQVGAAAAADDFISVGKPGYETAPQGPGLTPQQVRAIFLAPGAATVAADIYKLVAVV